MTSAPCRTPPREAVTPADAIDIASPWRDAARGAAFYAPYLNRLMLQRPDLVAAMSGVTWPEDAARAAISAAHHVALEAPSLEDGMKQLRLAKQELHLACAIADLAGAWSLVRTTGVLTAFADACLAASVAMAAHELAERGFIHGASQIGERGPLPGFALIAMGKMGARELNYSSDIDFSVFYEPDLLPCAAGKDARSIALRAVQLIVKTLEEVTAEGYVFRTDLRLRPDPASTPPAVTIAAAEIYYQSLGQNWERAAFIKARAASGDIALGTEFLDSIHSFIWRRHLDYAAVADVRSIKRQILSTHDAANVNDPVCDVKLGRGGIRDIELHAQTQQLIFGGRNDALRSPRTMDALSSLEAAGVIDAAHRRELAEAYEFLRRTEHRIQMLEDAHTHKTPRDSDERARLAALCGAESLAQWEQRLCAHRTRVWEIDRALFGRFETLADPSGSLIFTGVEDNAETIATLENMGFVDPQHVAGEIRGWHHGRIRAMRSERARELLTALTPRLLRSIAETGAADEVFSRFASFFGALSGGVQVLSLLQAQPKFLNDLITGLSMAPRLAGALASRPALLDAMIEARFDKPLAEDPPGERRGLLSELLGGATDFEGALNAARRFKREETFRVCMQVIDGRADAGLAGAAHADIAETLIAALTCVALREVERVHGAQPGVFCVAALGKFGGREMTEGSDLDVMLIYDCAPGSDEAASGASSAYYARVAQRLISAIAAPTEEGCLYEVDMQLRPSGSKGPVAVQFSAFSHYYEHDAWTWELLALTRLRCVAGDAAFARRVEAEAKRILTAPRNEQKVKADIADMRARMERERPARGPWDLKLSAGGMVDLEFLAQGAQLVSGDPATFDANTGAALAKLAAAGALDADVARKALAGWSLLGRLQQVLRSCFDGDIDAAAITPRVAALLAREAQAPDIEAVSDRLSAQMAAVRGVFRRWTDLGDGI